LHGIIATKARPSLDHGVNVFLTLTAVTER
jgi:hypothetical protein